MSAKSAYEMLAKRPSGARERRLRIWDGSGTDSGRSMIPSAIAKIEESAPMASVMEMIAVRAKPGFRRRVRIAYRKSLSMLLLIAYRSPDRKLFVINNLNQRHAVGTVRTWDVDTRNRTISAR